MTSDSNYGIQETKNDTFDKLYKRVEQIENRLL